MSTSTNVVPEKKLDRIQTFIGVLEGGSLADALMSLVVAYQQRGLKITHLKEKLARVADSPDSP